MHHSIRRTQTRGVLPAPVAETAFHEVADKAFDMGFVGAVYLFTARPAGVQGASTAPMIAVRELGDAVKQAGWEAIYFRERLFKIDPILRASLDRTLPFWWGNAARNGIVGAETPLTACEVDMFRRCEDCTGVCSGVTVPLHSAYGGIGYLSLLATEPLPHLKHRLEQEENNVLGMAHRFHDQVMRQEVRIQYENITLSARETQCLSLISMGKTLEETALALELSYSTVRFHVRNACKKLRTENRTRAVAKAAFLGMLGPVD